jgi:hypothetical protein
LGTVDAMLTVNVITIEPAPGIEKVPNVGLVSPRVGFTVAVRVAPPLRAMLTVAA